MNVDMYLLVWNNADMLDFMFRHYDPIVRRYVAFDDGSTDGSLEILRAHPRVEIRALPPLEIAGSHVLRALGVWETCWRETSGDADWVIIADVDEHLHHPDLMGYLGRCLGEGVTIIPALGYQMLSDALPATGRLCDQVTRGAPWAQMSKLGAFAPRAIDALNYGPGRHQARLTGRLVAPVRDELLLLHYKYLGFERVLRQIEQARERLTDVDRSAGHGHRWRFSRRRLMRDWRAFEARAVDVSRPDLEPWRTHTEPRWWRSADGSLRMPDALPASRPRASLLARGVRRLRAMVTP